MANVVKKTMHWGVLDLVFPDYCWNCGRLGRPLCECCKKNLILEWQNYCPVCLKACEFGCKECQTGLDMVFVAGWKKEVFGRMAMDLKFRSARTVAAELAGVINEILPKTEVLGCGKEVVLVPLPTIRRHVRERGIDHTYLIAKNLGKLRGWKVERILGRRRNTVQVGAGGELRHQQAQEAYGLDGEISADKVYLLLDDIWTTGASMQAAAKVLWRNGAERVLAVVVAATKQREEDEVEREDGVNEQDVL